MTKEDSATAGTLGGIDGRTFDVVIIGGGISGASSAQHLAAAGSASFPDILRHYSFSCFMELLDPARLPSRLP